MISHLIPGYLNISMLQEKKASPRNNLIKMLLNILLSAGTYFSDNFIHHYLLLILLLPHKTAHTPTQDKLIHMAEQRHLNQNKSHSTRWGRDPP